MREFWTHLIKSSEPFILVGLNESIHHAIVSVRLMQHLTRCSVRILEAQPAQNKTINNVSAKTWLP